MIEAKTVLELFEGHPERWCKCQPALDKTGSPIYPTHPSAASWCLVGACHAVYGFGTDATARACKAIKKAVGDVDHMGEFNDTHTFEEVLEVVRKAGV